MHLLREANQRLHLVLEVPGEVTFVNEALVLAGHPLRDGESVMSSPITPGGTFPKTLGVEDSDDIVSIIDKVTKPMSGTTEDALSKKPEDRKPEDIKKVGVARLAIYLTLYGDVAAINRELGYPEPVTMQPADGRKT